jgi:hypothetical protein
VPTVYDPETDEDKYAKPSSGLPADYDRSNPSRAQSEGHIENEGSGKQRRKEVDDLENLYKAEAIPDEDRNTRAEKQEAEQVGQKTGEGTDGGFFKDTGKKSGGMARLRNVSKRKAVLGGGFGGIVIALLVFGLSSIVPYRLALMMNDIQDRVGEVPQYAVEKRLQYHMNRYLIQKAAQRIGGPNVAGREFVYLGKSSVGTLYTNWQGPKLEAQLFDEDNVQLIPKGDRIDFVNGRTRASSWKIDLGPPLGEKDLNSKEAREFIRTWTNDKTKSKQVMKRYHMRRILRNYYGVPDWKPFEKEREAARGAFDDKIRSRYVKAKTNLKKYVVRRTVTPVSARTGAFLNCFIDTSNNPVKTCGNNLRKKSVDVDTPKALLSDSDVDDIVDGAGKKVAREAGEEITEEGAQQIAKTATGAISKKVIVGAAASGVGVIDLAAKIVSGVESGMVQTIQYNRSALQYASFATPFDSMSDQILSGEDYDPEQVQAAVETIGDFEQSPVYQAGLASPGSVSAQEKSYHRDCNDDGDTNDTEDILEPGETVCPNKKVLQNQFDFQKNIGWDGLSAVASVWNETFGRVVDWAGDLVNEVLEVTGVTNAITAAMDASGASDLVAAQVESLMNQVLGVAITGEEEGAAAYDAIYAGKAVQQSSLGGGVGEAREDTIGGGYLSDAQVAAINAEQQEFKEYENSQKSMYARYFSPKESDSLTAKAIMATPTSASGFATSITSSLNFGSIFSRIADPLTGTSQAADYQNPFNVINYGFSADHEVFTANDGEGMDPDVLWEKYECAKPASEREQNTKFVGGPDNPELPFEVYSQPDPCLLEQAAIDAGERYFTGTYDEGIDDAAATTTTTEATPAPANPGELPSGEAQDLARQVIDSGKVTGNSRYIEQIQNVANGTGGCNVNPKVLSLLLYLSTDFSMYITSLNRFCTGVLTASGEASFHWREGGGHAVDIGSVNGTSSTGGTGPDLELLRKALEVLPSGSGIGQINCRSAGSLQLPSGIREFNDSCNHIHIQVPVE